MAHRWSHAGRLPAPLYWLCQRLVPMGCVDVLPRQLGPSGVHVGLIRRKGEGESEVWALVGGGVHRGESLADAIDRHLLTTLGPNVSWVRPDTRSPSLVAEYFPHERQGHGVDLRKHAIALTYLVDIEGEPQAAGEALDFEWFTRETLPPAKELWSGQHLVVMKLLNSEGPDNMHR